MKKTVLFAFDPETTVFGHMMLNALDMKRRGFDVRVVIEGDAVKQISFLRNETKPFADVYAELRSAGLIDGVCKACATRAGVVPAAIEQQLKLLDELQGHPSMARYLEQGYEVVTF